LQLTLFFTASHIYCPGYRLVTRTIAHALTAHKPHSLTADSRLTGSESELPYYYRFTTNRFVLAPIPLRITARIFFSIEHLRSKSLYNILSDEKWTCRLQLLLALASAFILRSESRRTHDHILLFQIRDSHKLEPRSPYLYPPGTGWPSYTPRHWVPSPSPFTTRRATVEAIRTLLHTLEGHSAIP
jgi:hypothetical protein